jgi:hypothetical protein
MNSLSAIQLTPIFCRGIAKRLAAERPQLAVAAAPLAVALSLACRQLWMEAVVFAPPHF